MAFTLPYPNAMENSDLKIEMGMTDLFVSNHNALNESQRQVMANIKYTMEYLESAGEMADVGSAAAYIDEKLAYIYPPNLLKDGGRFALEPYPSSATGVLGVFTSGEAFASTYNGAVFSEEGEFYHDNSTYEGAGAALSVGVIAVLDASGIPEANRRYGSSWKVMQIASGSGTAASRSVNGELYYLTNTASNPVGDNCTSGLWVTAVNNPVAVLAEGATYVVVQPGETKYVVNNYLNSDYGYFNPINIFMKQNSLCNVAHPYIGLGDLNLKPTNQPIPSLLR